MNALIGASINAIQEPRRLLAVLLVWEVPSPRQGGIRPLKKGRRGIIDCGDRTRAHSWPDQIGGK